MLSSPEECSSKLRQHSLCIPQGGVGGRRNFLFFFFFLGGGGCREIFFVGKKGDEKYPFPLCRIRYGYSLSTSLMAES